MLPAIISHVSFFNKLLGSVASYDSVVKRKTSTHAAIAKASTTSEPTNNRVRTEKKGGSEEVQSENLKLQWLCYFIRQEVKDSHYSRQLMWCDAG